MLISKPRLRERARSYLLKSSRPLVLVVFPWCKALVIPQNSSSCSRICRSSSYKYYIHNQRSSSLPPPPCPNQISFNRPYYTTATMRHAQKYTHSFPLAPLVLPARPDVGGCKDCKPKPSIISPQPTRWRNPLLSVGPPLSTLSPSQALPLHINCCPHTSSHPAARGAFESYQLESLHIFTYCPWCFRWFLSCHKRDFGIDSIGNLAERWITCLYWLFFLFIWCCCASLSAFVACYGIN